MKCKVSIFLVALWVLAFAAPVWAEGPLPSAPSAAITFAVIGDYGSAGSNELAVANRVKSWNPDLIITVGDNNYGSGEASTIDANIGQYYHDYIYPYTGKYGAGAATNRFFPTLGNHDWRTTTGGLPKPYLDYFTLPNNERYYDFVKGPVHFFALDSGADTGSTPTEPDGITSTSTQGKWLQSKLASSTSCWNVVYVHHAPYSSGTSHGSNPTLQWPYQAWGADAVLAGHEHNYERIILNGFPYMVNGLGGDSRYSFGTPIPGSVARYYAKYGAQRVTATDTTITYEFINVDGTVIDTYTQTGGCTGVTPGTSGSLFIPIIIK